MYTYTQTGTIHTHHTHSKYCMKQQFDEKESTLHNDVTNESLNFHLILKCL